MSEQQIRVTFEPQGRSVYVLKGTLVVEAAARAGLTVDSPCGGAGTCGKCRVRFAAHAPIAAETDRRRLSPEQLDDGWRLACQTTVQRSCVIEVPESSLLGTAHQILAQRQEGALGEVLPAVRKVFVQLPRPSLQDAQADLLRLERLTGPVKADLDVLRRLGAGMRRQEFAGTAVLTDHRLIDFESGDTTDRCYGVAFDIGTTTLVGSLLDLRNGREAAIASDVNPQVSLGDDVVSRISHGSTAQGLGELRSAIVKAVGKLIDRLCAETKVAREHIYEAAFSGNTTMQHLLCGIDPSPLGEVPFVPAHAQGLLLRASELGIAIHPGAMAYVFPVIGGFVGGDTSAGILATGLESLGGPVLLVDIGTNGEIVLSHGGRMWAASTAAGPAFEGARISCGMRATAGAIEKVIFDGGVHCNVIGKREPIGLCGSGLIDAAAEMLRHGVLSSDGRLRAGGELPAGLCPAIGERVVQSDAQAHFVLAWTRDKAPVALTQRDIRELQLATGAIRAGIAILLRQAGLTAGDLGAVLVAGGFGSFIRRSNAQRIGLLPPDIPHERIRYVGNASLEGCKCALLSTAARKRGEELARAAKHVELSMDAAFQNEFAESMIFPG